MAGDQVRAAGFEPQETFPGWCSRPWKVRCADCKKVWTITLTRVRGGLRCTHHARKRVERHRLTAAGAGFTPLDPSPRQHHLPWKVSCTRCGREQIWSLAKMKSGGARCVCVRHEEAAAEMRSAGYRPKVTYPGRARMPWPSVCTVCGQDRRPSLSTVRSGGRCAHDTPEMKRKRAGTLSS